MPELDTDALASCRAFLDYTVMEIRTGQLAMEQIVTTLLRPHQPLLRRDLTPQEQIDSLAVMLALALDDLAKHGGHSGE